MQGLVVEISIQSDLNHLEIRRDVKIAWCEQTVMSDVHHLINAAWTERRIGCLLLDNREDGYRMDWNAWAISVEQMAREGSPEHSAIIRLRGVWGTGGVAIR